MWFHQLHNLPSPDQDDLGVSQPGHVQRPAPKEGHHARGATAQVLGNADTHEGELEGNTKPCCVYLSSGLFHKALVGELERPAEGLAGVVAEGFLPYEVHVEVVGSINGGVHATVTIKHSEIGLLFLILLDDTSHMTTPSSTLTPLVERGHRLYLNIEERVEVGDDDVLVLHLPPHVFDGVDRCFIVRLRSAVEGQLLHPQAAHFKESVEHQPGQLHRLQL